MSALDPKGYLRALLSNPGETPGWGSPGGFLVSPLAAPAPAVIFLESQPLVSQVSDSPGLRHRD